MKKIHLISTLLFLAMGCQKTPSQVANGFYSTQCRYVKYQVGANGYEDSTVYERTFFTLIDIKGGNTNSNPDKVMYLDQPNVDERLYRVESNKENVVRYENYSDRSPDGDPDTLSVEINLKTLEIEVIHVGHSMFLFDTAPFSIVDYREVCRGFKVED